MIVDRFKIKDWEVTILYDATCDDDVISFLEDINCPFIEEALNNLETCDLNIGLTYSNIRLKSSVIVIGKTSSKEELINTVAHEYYHLICHISKALQITDEEDLANLNGYLNMYSFKFVQESGL